MQQSSKPFNHHVDIWQGKHMVRVWIIAVWGSSTTRHAVAGNPQLSAHQGAISMPQEPAVLAGSGLAGHLLVVGPPSSRCQAAGQPRPTSH